MMRSVAVHVGMVVSVIGILVLLAGAIVGTAQLALHGPPWFRVIAIGAGVLTLGNLVLWIPNQIEQIERRRRWRQVEERNARRAAAHCERVIRRPE